MKKSTINHVKKNQMTVRYERQYSQPITKYEIGTLDLNNKSLISHFAQCIRLRKISLRIARINAPINLKLTLRNQKRLDLRSLPVELGEFKKLKKLERVRKLKRQFEKSRMASFKPVQHIYNKLVGSKMTTPFIKVRIKPVNFTSRHSFVFRSHKVMKWLRNRLFLRGTNLAKARRDFNKFIRIFSLFAHNKVSAKLFLTQVGKRLKYLHKRKHGLFLAFLSQITKLVITKDTRIVGIKFHLNGKLKGKTRASSSDFSLGHIQRKSTDVNRHYSLVPIETKYGTYGLRMWANFKNKSINI